MNDFFSTPERIDKLRQEVGEWIGTPFIDGIGARAQKQTACDCVSWIASTLGACGAVGPVPWPTGGYASETGGPEMFVRLLEVLKSIPRLDCIWDRVGKKPDLLPGDLMVGTRGRSGHHMALCVGGNQIAHCWAGEVRWGSAADSMLVKHLHSLYRARE